MEKNLVPRERFLEKIRPVYDVDIIKVLMGPRRSGKSVILSMIADEVEADADHKIYIIDFDKNYIEEAKDIALPNRGFYNSNGIVKNNVIVLMDANNCVTEYDSENNMFYYYT